LGSRSAVDRPCALSVAGIARQRGGKRLTLGSAFGRLAALAHRLRVLIKTLPEAVRISAKIANARTTLHFAAMGLGSR
jgi:hypothetical protein